MPYYANRRRPSMAAKHTIEDSHVLHRRQLPPNIDKSQLRKLMAAPQPQILTKQQPRRMSNRQLPKRLQQPPMHQQQQQKPSQPAPRNVPVYLDPIRPETWGPVIWSTMHVIAAAYPTTNPTEDDKETYRMFYETLAHVLPCLTCREHFNEIIAEYPLSDEHLASRKSLAEWVVGVRNKVSAAIGKSKIVLYSDLQKFVNMNANLHQVVVVAAEPKQDAPKENFSKQDVPKENVSKQDVSKQNVSKQPSSHFATMRSMAAKFNSRPVATAVNLAVAKQAFDQTSTVPKSPAPKKKAGCGCAAKRKAAMAARNRYG